MRLAARSMTATLVLLLCAGSTARAQATFPESWAGTWTLTEVETGCDGAQEPVTFQRTIVIQAGDGPEIWDPVMRLDSSSESITDTRLEYAGSETAIQGPCVSDNEVVYEMTRAGNSLTGTKRIAANTTGCPGSFCLEFAVTGTRSSVPVSAVTWSRIKTLYP
jgi:hypothetical protein